MNLNKVSISEVRNIGPKREQVLNTVGIYSVADLLHYYPRRHLDRQTIQKIGDIKPDMGEVTLIATCFESMKIPGRNRQTRLKASFSDDTGILNCNWFRGGEWIANKLIPGEEYIISGVPKFFGGWAIDHPVLEMIDNEKGATTLNQGRIIPLYPLTGELSKNSFDSRAFRKIIKNALDQFSEFIEDLTPQNILKEHNLPDLKTAINLIHFPEDDVSKNIALKRLKFDELFHLQLIMAKRRANVKLIPKKNKIKSSGKLLKAVYKKLPFELTEAQKKVIREIYEDLKSDKLMNRMLQGDVGSGKTVVALLSMLMMIDNGYQAAIMAPTEILAEQHYLGFHKFCEELGLHISLLQGKTKKKQKEEIISNIASGTSNIIIGTHALIQKDVKFHKLGLVVIDEQHRFGVMQRGAFMEKAKEAPNLLVMTATPIPRTLSLSLYGDLDISIIDTLPKGRKPIKTAKRTENDLLKIYKFIDDEVAKGHQAYIVYPLIEKSKKLDIQAAEEGFTYLSTEEFPKRKVAMLHGKMKNDEKDGVMQAFKDKKIDILVSTTVVEVGVDVPNATVMLIMHCERFGLSQLHQLRGRVGRGSAQSYCILHVGNKVPEDTTERVKVMVSTTDGFKISEEDFKLRGPGEFLGEKQSGMPELKLASLLYDAKLMVLARKSAFKLIAEDNILKNYPDLRDYMNKRFEDKIKFLDYS
ncbi:MAG: ATP-dependent DNA helicase RecG [Candidatus Delongbacteria bacterium]|jgi:ATP-dependent DNA helicase RecG|nr:ATP-dependent DNA helicase RecG [Candidatus Delongbacteria bacterium]